MSEEYDPKKIEKDLEKAIKLDLEKHRYHKQDSEELYQWDDIKKWVGIYWDFDQIVANIINVLQNPQEAAKVGNIGKETIETWNDVGQISLLAVIGKSFKGEKTIEYNIPFVPFTNGITDLLCDELDIERA